MLKSNLLKTLRNEGRIVFKSKFLKDLSHTEAYEFIQHCHKRNFKAGEYIYHQNDPGNGMYFLEEGQVELIVENDKENENLNESSSAFILDPPECFGNLSVSYEMRRMSSAKALTDVQVMGFFSSDLETLQKRYPKIALKFLNEVNNSLAKQLQATLMALVQASDVADAYRLQFETYYADSDKKTF
jgi:CRP-like cAMP-binding protein